jgi:hypothetical protein
MHSQAFSYRDVMGFDTTTWREVAAAPPIPWTEKEHSIAYDKVLCCPKEVNQEGVDWGRCRDVDIMAHNHTASFLRACGDSIRCAGLNATYPVQLNGSNLRLSSCPTM